MNRIKPIQTSFILSILIFNYFFWKENLGINLLIFSVLLISILLINYKKAVSSGKVQITLAGTLITSIMVVLYNSAESKIAQLFSFMLLVAFIHESGLKSVVFAFLHMLHNILLVPVNFLKEKNDAIKKFPLLNKTLRLIKQSILPLSVAFIFFLLYCFANPLFGSYANIFFDKLLSLANIIFKEISFSRIFFLIFGAILLSAVYYRNEVHIFLKMDVSFREKLERVKGLRKSKSKYSGLSHSQSGNNDLPFTSIALKNQNRRGIILLLLVNSLLLIENIIDIKWLWFGFDLPEEFSLKHYVREGTGFLIVSILLSMALLLHYFRKNQNFYPKNKLLKQLAYFWIAQNVVLCISVFLRNYHYIDFHGLAYKRIGVDVFLLLTVVGLITLFLKIRDLRSAYYLVRVNTWAFYFILVLLSCINWDVRIAEYNLAHWNKGEIDVDFYLQLSDKAMPVIFKNLDKVEAQIETHKKNKVTWIKHLDFDRFTDDLIRKRERFLLRHESHSWLSYNVQDERTYRTLSGRDLAFKSIR